MTHFRRRLFDLKACASRNT